MNNPFATASVDPSSVRQPSTADHTDPAAAAVVACIAQFSAAHRRIYEERSRLRNVITRSDLAATLGIHYNSVVNYEDDLAATLDTIPAVHIVADALNTFAPVLHPDDAADLGVPLDGPLFRAGFFVARALAIYPNLSFHDEARYRTVGGHRLLSLGSKNATSHIDNNAIINAAIEHAQQNGLSIETGTLNDLYVHVRRYLEEHDDLSLTAITHQSIINGIVDLPNDVLWTVDLPDLDDSGNPLDGTNTRCYVWHGDDRKNKTALLCRRLMLSDSPLHEDVLYEFLTALPTLETKPDAIAPLLSKDNDAVQTGEQEWGLRSRGAIERPQQQSLVDVISNILDTSPTPPTTTHIRREIATTYGDWTNPAKIDRCLKLSILFDIDELNHVRRATRINADPADSPLVRLVNHRGPLTHAAFRNLNGCWSQAFTFDGEVKPHPALLAATGTAPDRDMLVTINDVDVIISARTDRNLCVRLRDGGWDALRTIGINGRGDRGAQFRLIAVDTDTLIAERIPLLTGPFTDADHLAYNAGILSRPDDGDGLRNLLIEAVGMNPDDPDFTFSEFQRRIERRTFADQYFDMFGYTEDY